MSGISVKFTYQDLLTAPDDGNRYEIFEGELIVTPSPVVKHQNASANLMHFLDNHVRKHNLGKVFAAPLDVYFDEETIVKPDLLFISHRRKYIIEEQRIHGAPDLIVEILSPSTAERDRGFKLRRYAKEEVREYWLADPEAQTLEIYILTQTGYELHQKFTGEDPVSSPLFQDLTFRLDKLWQ